ncbi:transcription initiation factor IID, 18kD subunit-domain-containing protein [Obelidium mucronatum]|nr:transcription initiation factor IID, 18kD subunit-domain-containing protein [Obelidium mucronatum]
MSDDERPVEREKRGSGPRKRIFTKEIRQIMYGYGDVLNPAEDTAEVMEDMLLMFMEDLCTKAVQSSSNGRIKMTDLTYVLRKDPKKLGRVLELIALEKELNKARSSLGNDPLMQIKGKSGLGKRTREDGDNEGDDNHYVGGLVLPNANGNNNEDNNYGRDRDEIEDDYDDILD